MIADGLHLLLNLPDLGWATADAPKQLKKKQAQQLKKKKAHRSQIASRKETMDLFFLLTPLCSFTKPIIF